MATRSYLTRLPPELVITIYKKLGLFIWQVNFAQALTLIIGERAAFKTLTEEASDKLYENDQVASFVFGAGGITGHGGPQPRIKPFQSDPLNADSKATTYNSLINKSLANNDQRAADRLREIQRSRIVRHRRDTVSKSPAARHGSAKPTNARKAQLGFLDRTYKRTYKELRVAFATSGTRYNAIVDAEEQDETRALAKHKNFEVLKALCNNLRGDDLRFRSVCRGCMKYLTWGGVSGASNIASTKIPFCQECAIPYMKQTMADGMLLKVVETGRNQLFTQLINHKTLWFKPVSGYSFSGGYLYFLQHEEADVLHAMLFASEDQKTAALTGPTTLPHSAVRKIMARFEFILEGISEAAAQYGHHGCHYVSLAWLSQRDKSNLVAFGLSPRLFAWFTKLWVINAGDISFAADAMTFFANVFDTGGIGGFSRNDPRCISKAVAMFWRQVVKQHIGRNELHALMRIEQVHEWSIRADPESLLHRSTHPLDNAIHYFDIMRYMISGEDMLADDASMIAETSEFDAFVELVRQILDCYPRTITALCMRMVALACNKSGVFDSFIIMIAHWWRTRRAQLSKLEAAHQAGSLWLKFAARAFWSYLGSGNLVGLEDRQSNVISCSQESSCLRSHPTILGDLGSAKYGS